MVAAAACTMTAPTKTATTQSAPVLAPPVFGEAVARIQPAVSTDIAVRLQQLPRTTIDYDRALLDENERQVVAKLIEASRYLDEIFLRQVSVGNPQVRTALELAAGKSLLHRDALELFRINMGSWDRLRNDESFVAPFGAAGEKPAGGGFYQDGISKKDVESWIEKHPEAKADVQGLFTVLKRKGESIVTVPYSQEYREFLVPAAARLREAAALTKNASLRKYLNGRADAFLSDDYYQSDLAWMDLDSPIEVVIGPYEVYEDNFFNYKAAFESFVTVVDAPESRKLDAYAQHLPDMERNLPIADVYKNPNRGTSSPIKVVQEIFVAGDARHGVQTAAFNLPNDERVREAKGSKKVLLKNVMEAKYKQSGQPIGIRVLDPSQTSLINFDAFFNQVLFHELSHGLGPGVIKGPNGEKVEYRFLLKELHSTIEECKADVLGVWNILYAMDHQLLSSFSREQLYATDVALMFRSMRFGLNEAHGRGTAIQWNWYREKGAIVPAGDGRFRVDFARMPEAVRSLASELLLIEATGDYTRGKALLDMYGRSNAEIDAMTAKLTDIPVDITPVFTAAGEGKGN